MMRSGHHFLRAKDGLAQRVVKAGLPAWTDGMEVLRDVAIQQDTRSLVAAFCLPRVRMYSSTMWGTTSMAGRANDSSSSSGASGSSAMPLLISQLLTYTEPWSGSCESVRITTTDG